MRSVVQLCLATNNILLMLKLNHAFSFLQSLLHEMADRFAYLSEFKEETRWLNDKTILKLGYRKILCFVSVSQSTIFLSLWYFAQPRPIFVKYFTKISLRCSRPLRFPAENKADADSRNFHSSKIDRINFINNPVKPKFQLPFGLLGSQSCK